MWKNIKKHYFPEQKQFLGLIIYSSISGIFSNTIINNLILLRHSIFILLYFLLYNKLISSK